MSCPLLPILLCAAALGAGDPWEVGPCREAVLFTVPWGEGQDRFFQPDWEAQEVTRGPGPYALAEDGTVFVLDMRNRRMAHFDQAGVLLASFALPEAPEEAAEAVPRDLAVRGGLACWRSGTDRLCFLDLSRCPSPSSGAPASTTHPGIPRDAFRSALLPGHGRPFLIIGGHADIPNARAGELIGIGESILFLDWTTGMTSRLTEGARLLSAEEERASRVLGLPISPSATLYRTNRSDAEGARYALDGRRIVAGDLVTMTPGGQLNRLLVESAGWPLGADSRGDFLVEWTEDAEWSRQDSHTGRMAEQFAVYLALYSPQGELLSRTREPLREFRGTVLVGPPFRMGEDCYYEWWLSRQGAHLSRWSR